MSEGPSRSYILVSAMLSNIIEKLHTCEEEIEVIANDLMIEFNGRIDKGAMLWDFLELGCASDKVNAEDEEA